MPGTIHVSVMDFQGPPSTSTSPTFLRVSLGKREYQTLDNGDFSFPLTNFRDNLVIKLLDVEGNEIAHTGIQTMSIVQKVLWDEFFFFEGGGFVHLKIQFILNEEERTRIRLKREAAVREKHGSIPNISEKYSDISLSTGSSITSALQADRVISEERKGASSAPTLQGTEVHFVEANQIAIVKKLETESLLPNVHTESVKKGSSRLVYPGSDVAEISSSIFHGKDDDYAEKSVEIVPLEKTPSNKDSVSSAQVPTVSSETKGVGKQGHLKDFDPEGFAELAKRSSGKQKDPFSAGVLNPNLEISTERRKGTDSAKSSYDNLLNEMMKTREKLTAAPFRSVENESSSRAWAAESSAQLERSSPTEKATVSGRMHMDLSEREYSFRPSAQKRHSGGTLSAEERGKTDSTKIDIQVASIEKSKSLDYFEEELLYSENSGMWVFPNNTEHLCVTAAGKKVMNLLGSGPPETNSYYKKKSSFSSGEGSEASEYDGQKDQKGSQRINNSSAKRSPDGASGGLFGQVLKIAIIVGFGVLVLITRKREFRKSKRETDELLLAASEFLDEQILLKDKEANNA